MYKDFDFSKMPVVDAVNEIIISSVEKGASDIHFDPSDDLLKVRIRVDGILDILTVIPSSVKQNIVTRIKLLSGMNITETRLPQDGALKTVLKGHNLDLRVSSLPTKKGEKIVIRILDYSMSLKGIEYLYFSEINYKKILKMIGSPNGIILVTGATGSGKSTTVYSFLQRLNVEGVNLVTVEDPVEMDIKGINQVQVNSDIGLDSATVLRSILRQDPNIIMIGEIRDSETARIAVRASITGHLVLSTIHTNNSLNTIERLLDMDVERYLLASALEGIISQTLARKLCDKCKQVRGTTPYEKQLFRAVLGRDVNQVYMAGDCAECHNGYKGRIALQEVLLINQEIRDAISAGAKKEELRKLVYTDNVITMLQDGLYKVLAGFTTLEEVLKLVDVEDDVFEEKNENNLITDNKEDKTSIITDEKSINTNNNNNVNNSNNIIDITPTPINPTITPNTVVNNVVSSINDGIASLKQNFGNKNSNDMVSNNNNNNITPTINPMADLNNNNSNVNMMPSIDNNVDNEVKTNQNVNNNIMPNLNNTSNVSPPTANSNSTNVVNANSSLGNGFNMQDNFVNMNLG